MLARLGVTALALAGGDDQVWADVLDGLAASAAPEQGVQHVLGDHQPGSSAIAALIVAGPVGELSVRYDPALKSWEMMTITTWETGTVEKVRGAIVVRLAPQPTGPWGAPITVATYKEYPSLYGGFLHPDSKGSDIFFTMTQYDRYNVSLMHARLPANAISNPQKP